MVERDGSAKSTIFTQFTSFMDLIHYSLQKREHYFVYTKRIEIVVEWCELAVGLEMCSVTWIYGHEMQDAVLLMSLKAGGVALNLTVASHVFLMDPWWNPAAEQQPQDRIQRIGQFKSIRSRGYK